MIEYVRRSRSTVPRGGVRTRPAALVRDVLASPGRPLEPDARADLEAQFGCDFSRVRVHADATAAASADAVDALAYTVGRDVVFAQGRYQPDQVQGRRLLAHELAHVAQQGQIAVGPDAELRIGEPGDACERQADAVSGGARPAAFTRDGSPGVVRRRHREPGPVSVRSPVAEEVLTQVSDVLGGVTGRTLGAAERAMATGVFGASIDLDRVRLIPTDVLEYRTVGNNVRVPRGFTADDAYMAQTLIHELTHVWQYQHGGTSYISHSLQTQIAGAVRGNRNFAYAYELTSRSSFFDFTPEQQASIVENYFAMGRDKAAIALAGGVTGWYSSNHQGPDGFPVQLSAAERSAEIGTELPLHERVLAQLRAALPVPEHETLMLRASEVMRTPGQDALRDPSRDLSPGKPLLEVRFPGL
ncbi:eCIS core domain-containing protein [Streptomyces sp. CA-106131]|uniref:eCIS core domain-containing protein n=1 Tax=Streptomyces sp. CA-106131 TaxID=3240045 RepID=UPI003D90A3FE